MAQATISYGSKLGLLNNAAISEVYYDQFRPFLRGVDALVQASVLSRMSTPHLHLVTVMPILFSRGPLGCGLDRPTTLRYIPLRLQPPGLTILRRDGSSTPPSRGGLYIRWLTPCSIMWMLLVIGCPA